MRFPIPDVALDDRLAILGTAGAGKTYLTLTAIERLLSIGARTVAIDPLGVMWGLRLKADGVTQSRFNVPIFGGRHGDLPLTEQAGALIGETVATMRESCIVDLSELPTKAAERRFMTAFLESIYRHTDPTKTDPYHLIIDEADRFAPQRPPAGDETMLNRMEEIVRRGRVKGFIPWLITQRPAVLNKNVLSQADGLVLLKLTSSQDRDQVGAWIEGQADRAEGRAILGALPAMQRGQGVVWIPGRSILETVQFPTKTTFDSSSAPKRGEARRTTELKPLDLGALKDQLASIEVETKANDPAALKAEVARLTRDLAKAQKAAIAAPPAPPPVVANADEIEEARRQGELTGIAIGIARAQQAVAALRVDQSEASPAPKARQSRDTPARAPVQSQPVVASAGVTVPQQKILNALAWWKAFGIDQPTREQVGFIAGYSPGSGGFANLTGGLRSAGLIDYPAGGKLALTDAGCALGETPATGLTREAFHDRVRAKLSGPQVRLLDPILEAYPAAITVLQVAGVAGYSAGSGGFANLRGSLRTIGIIDYPASGQVRAADWLFP